MAGVSDDVSADWVDGVAEEHVGLSHDLVGDYGYGVEGACEADEFVHVFVEFLLAEGEGFSAYVLAAEVGG